MCRATFIGSWLYWCTHLYMYFHIYRDRYICWFIYTYICIAIFAGSHCCAQVYLLDHTDLHSYICCILLICTAIFAWSYWYAQLCLLDHIDMQICFCCVILKDTAAVFANWNWYTPLYVPDHTDIFSSLQPRLLMTLKEKVLLKEEITGILGFFFSNNVLKNLQAESFSNIEFAICMTVFSISFRVEQSWRWRLFNSSPNNKILDWSKLKAFADNKMNVTEKLKFVLGSIFLLFPHVFKRCLIQAC